MQDASAGASAPAVSDGHFVGSAAGAAGNSRWPMPLSKPLHRSLLLQSFVKCPQAEGFGQQWHLHLGTQKIAEAATAAPAMELSPRYWMPLLTGSLWLMTLHETR